MTKIEDWKQRVAEERSARKVKTDRITAILHEHGIDMAVGGCGCCGSPWVTVIYRGEVIVDEESDLSFDTREA